MNPTTSGDHTVKSWALRQPIVALSSGEAEYCSVVNGVSIAVGIISLDADSRIDMGVEQELALAQLTGEHRKACS